MESVKRTLLPPHFGEVGVVQRHDDGWGSNEPRSKSPPAVALTRAVDLPEMGR